MDRVKWFTTINTYRVLLAITAILTVLLMFSDVGWIEIGLAVFCNLFISIIISYRKRVQALELALRLTKRRYTPPTFKGTRYDGPPNFPQKATGKTNMENRSFKDRNNDG